MKFLHTMLRVKDLEESIKFYVDTMGFELVRKTEYPHGKFTLAFLSFKKEEDEPFLELTYNLGVTEYEQGSYFGHIAVGVENIHSICQEIREKGGKIIREPGPMKGSSSILAFVEDPDGHKIELLQRSL